MSEKAVADTGPILHLAEIGELRQLRLFEAISIPEQVRGELAIHGIWSSASDVLSDHLRIEKVSAEEMRGQGKALSAFSLHRADLSVAALAARIRPDVVLTDDLNLRRGLESRGHQAVGSVGILIRAFHTGRLPKTELLDRLDQLLDGSTLYTSKAFRAIIRTALDNLAD